MVHCLSTPFNRDSQSWKKLLEDLTHIDELQTTARSLCTTSDNSDKWKQQLLKEKDRGRACHMIERVRNDMIIEHADGYQAKAHCSCCLCLAVPFNHRLVPLLFGQSAEGQSWANAVTVMGVGFVWRFKNGTPALSNKGAIALRIDREVLVSFVWVCPIIGQVFCGQSTMEYF